MKFEPSNHGRPLVPARTVAFGRWSLLLGLMLSPTLHAENRVIILSPHVDTIRYEFGRAFALWHEALYGEKAAVEWRDAGGTSDAVRFLQSEFKNKPDGIGIDCLFGGGEEPYLILADKKLSVQYEPPPEILAGIPQNANGVDGRPPEQRHDERDVRDIPAVLRVGTRLANPH